MNSPIIALIRMLVIKNLIFFLMLFVAVVVVPSVVIIVVVVVVVVVVVSWPVRLLLAAVSYTAAVAAVLPCAPSMGCAASSPNMTTLQTPAQPRPTPAANIVHVSK